MTSPKIELLNEDCMNVMARYPDNHFDLACADPPYGIKQDGHRENNRSKLAISRDYNKALWAQNKPGPDYFEELKRVSKNQIIWGGNHLADLIGEFSPCWLVWNKNTSGNFADCELAYTSFKTAVRMFTYTWNGMIQGDFGSKSKNEVRVHPTQKPIALYDWIFLNYSEPGQRILDTHLGSGSSAVAAHYFGADFVGCEIEENYYNDACNRFEADTSQLELSI